MPEIIIDARRAAISDSLEVRIILPPNDNKEFIPLPETRIKSRGKPVGPAPEPLS